MIIGIPNERSSYFLFLLVAPSQFASDKGDLTDPTLISQVVPAYPEELRERGIEGQVELQVAIDTEGIVQAVRLTKSLHPYLDNAAVQALRQWRYKPAIKNGESVSVVMTLGVDFTKAAWKKEEERLKGTAASPSGSKPGEQDRLGSVLKGSGAYCLKLEHAALDFICEESIQDAYYDFNLEKAGGVEMSRVQLGSGLGGGVKFTPVAPFYDSRKTQRNEYLCDYQLSRKRNEIKETRVLIEENGKRIAEKKKYLDNVRFAALKPFFTPVKIFGPDRQRLFNYRIVDEEKINGRRTFVLEALPRSGDAGGIEYAKAWVDQRTFQVLRSEFWGIPLEGYDDVLKDCVELNIKPDFVITHQYEIEKNGVLFPVQSSISVKYPLFDPSNFQDPLRGNRLKLSTKVSYENYKFFTVETEDKIIR